MEQAQIKEFLARFQPEDQWNMDESALFAFNPPDCSLSQKQMSGKQANKFQITLAFACNSDGSEKKDLFFIGKLKKPQCFGWQGPIAHGFYYHANKTAWMTGALFEEWVHQFKCTHHSLTYSLGGLRNGISNWSPLPVPVLPPSYSAGWCWRGRYL